MGGISDFLCKASAPKPNAFSVSLICYVCPRVVATLQPLGCNSTTPSAYQYKPKLTHYRSTLGCNSITPSAYQYKPKLTISGAHWAVFDNAFGVSVQPKLTQHHDDRFLIFLRNSASSASLRLLISAIIFPAETQNYAEFASVSEDDFERFLRLNFPLCKNPTSSPFFPTTASDPIPFRFISSRA